MKLPNIELNRDELIYDPLEWQERGLSYTSSGYGAKIPTRHKVRYAGRLRRLYCRIYSNSGSVFLVVGGRERFVNINN